jgi:hypothetical protein
VCGGGVLSALRAGESENVGLDRGWRFGEVGRAGEELARLILP